MTTLPDELTERIFMLIGMQMRLLGIPNNYLNDAISTTMNFFELFNTESDLYLTAKKFIENGYNANYIIPVSQTDLN